MSVSTSSPLNEVTTVAVAPTETVVLSVSRELLRGAKRITVGVQNDDGSQTFAGTVYRRLNGMSVWAASRRCAASWRRASRTRSTSSLSLHGFSTK